MLSLRLLRYVALHHDRDDTGVRRLGGQSCSTTLSSSEFDVLQVGRSEIEGELLPPAVRQGTPQSLAQLGERWKRDLDDWEREG